MEDLADGLARLRLSTEEGSAGNTKSKAYSRKSRKRRDAEKTNNLYKFSPEDELRLAAAFGRGSNEEILAIKFNIPIHRRDIRLLQPEEWLNDEVINYYMNLLQEHCDSRYNEWQAAQAASPSPAPQPTANKTAPQRPRRKAKTEAQQRMRVQQQQSARTKKRVVGAHNHDRDQHHEGDDDDDKASAAAEEEVEQQEQEKKAEPEPEVKERPLRCHFFNTFFYPLLAKGGHARVARWTRRVDLMAMDLVVVPVHTHGIHWTLATAAPTAGTIAHYDSIHQPNSTCFDRLRAYFLHEEKEKNEAKKKERSEEKKKNEEQQDDGGDDKEEGDDGEDKEEEGERSWRMGNRAEECPRQTNGSDCGVFACMIARSCALGLPVSRVHQRDMPHYRRLMALEILSGAIIPSPPSSPPSSPRPTANVDVRKPSSS